MAFVIRTSTTELPLTGEPVLAGCSPDAGLRVEGAGVELVHVSVDATRIEAFADCEVGGVTLKRGGTRAVVPCTITIGRQTLEIAAAEESEDLSTRELALGAAVGPGKLKLPAALIP